MQSGDRRQLFPPAEYVPRKSLSAKPFVCIQSFERETLGRFKAGFPRKCCTFCSRIFCSLDFLATFLTVSISFI